jgi:hypothetical protein
MAKFHDLSLKFAGIPERTQCGLKKLRNSCWATFQSKKYLDKQRYEGFSFPVLVTFQRWERKYTEVYI